MTVASAHAFLIKHCTMALGLASCFSGALLLCPSAVEARDTITLLGGMSRITGQLTSITEQGHVEIRSALAPEMVVLHARSIELIECADQQQEMDLPRTQIEFINGDIIPARIESLDAQHLTIASPHLGRLVINRDAVATIRTGNQNPILVYQGPSKANDWDHESDDESDWKWNKRAMACTGHAEASRDVGLPTNFMIKFKLIWQVEALPNFHITFADSFTKKNQPKDRYILTFDEKELEILRESSSGEKFHSLLKLNSASLLQEDSSLAIEIHGNRNTGQMALQLPNQPLKEFVDPIHKIPHGQGMRIICHPEDGLLHEIRDIEVYGKDDGKISELHKNPAHKTSEILISRESDQWLGKLVSIGKENDELIYRFIGAIDQIEIAISEKDLSMIHLHSPPKTLPAAADRAFQFILFHGGRLTGESCQLREGVLTTTHSILGPISLPSHCISTMKKIPAIEK
jgi:hypothetical protein